MPTIRINNKDFELDNNYRKEFEENADVKALKENPNYKNLSNEEIIDVLIRQCHETIDKIYNTPHKLSEKAQGVLDNLRVKLKDRYENEFDAWNNEISEKWQTNIKNIRDAVLNNEIFAEYSKKYNSDDLQLIYTNIWRDELREVRTQNPEFYPKLEDFCSLAGEVVTYRIKFGSEDITKEQYAKNKLDYDFQTDCVKEPEYQEIKGEIEQAEALAESKRNAEFGKMLKFDDLLRTDSNRKEQCANLLKERDELVNKYNKTNIFSRIARWVLPNSWSKAGQIQNEIDKLDKAVKDAGYDKKEIENIKKEMKSENILDDETKNNELINDVEDVDELNGPETTMDLQQDVKDKTVLVEAENKKSQVVEKEDVQKGEIAVGQN